MGDRSEDLVEAQLILSREGVQLPEGASLLRSSLIRTQKEKQPKCDLFRWSSQAERTASPSRPKALMEATRPARAKEAAKAGCVMV